MQKKRNIDHAQVALRFVIVVFWLIVAALGYTLTSNINNALSVGVSGWIIYGASATIVLYLAVLFTSRFWSYK